MKLSSSDQIVERAAYEYVSVCRSEDSANMEWYRLFVACAAIEAEVSRLCFALVLEPRNAEAIRTYITLVWNFDKSDQDVEHYCFSRPGIIIVGMDCDWWIAANCR
jgi:hypothetical protein